MNRNQIIEELKQFFNIKELVCDHVYAKHGFNSWQFLQTDLLHVLLIIRRDILKVPMVVNAGVNKQRGLRCNLCPLVQEKTKNNKVYISGHQQGIAVDAISSHMSAAEMRSKIIAEQYKLPCNIRMEDDVTWLHVDTRPTPNNEKVYLFKA
ncbi:MAG: hypothetical protein J6V13_03820 [Paludibacteraceae bacterium]|nr:hypothetical protein [Paludibacteraceae bacterium]